MPPKRASPKGYSNARQLRKTPTPAEVRLWAHLRANKLGGVSFRRQHAIGRYVVDFCAPKHGLIIELDGSGHLNRQHDDTARTRHLEASGYRVIRFWNDAVLHNMDGVMAAILEALRLG